MNNDIKGLILTGGTSSRMGKDKGSIPYHGIPQRDYLAVQASKIIHEVYLSCHPERVPESSFPTLADVYTEMGPMGGLLTAFGMDGDIAWLTIPCDMPFIDMDIILELIEARDKSKMATCFLDPDACQPEPLFVIWERSALQVLLKARDESSFSLKKILMEGDCHLVKCAHPEKLRNVNTQVEYEEVVRMIEINMGDNKIKKG